MATVFTETFETDGNGTRYITSIPEFSDGSSDFFIRTNGNKISSAYQVLNPEGSFYFAAQDINGEAATSQQKLTFSGIDITSFTNLNLSILLAEDDSSDGNQDWDKPDFVSFEYQIDGGGFSNLLAIENDGSTFNSTALEDTDFDGTGDGTEITSSFESFSGIIAGTGSTLYLQITFDLNSGEEDIAIDNIQITGDNGSTGTNLAIAATDADRAEGDAGNKPFTFTVTRSDDTADATSVNFAVSGDVNAADFGGILPSGTVNFAADDISQVITVNVSGDTDSETDESFTVTLSNATGSATITTATASGTIQNDDGVAFTKIHEIQGNGASSPIQGNTVTIEAVVVGDFQDGSSGTDGDLNGFFVQEENADIDADLTTSEGIFIFDGSSPSVDVNVGDVVQVTGEVTEFNGLTELTNVTVSIQGTDSLPTPGIVNLPLTDVDDLEAVEGMQVNIPDTLFVTEYFNLDRFGEVVLSANDSSNQPSTDGRLDQYTQFNTPSVSGFSTYQDEIEKRRILLDDAQTVLNPDPIIHGRGGNPLSANNTLRGGDTVNNLSGILSFGFGEYRIQPTDAVNFQPTNPRPATPDDVGGDLTVASFNVLNYFTRLNSRGADTTEEFERQRDKIVSAIVAIDADVVGLIELENNGDIAISNLVNAINTELGSSVYDFISTGVVGTDAIQVGFIYQPDTVQPFSSFAVLDDSVDPSFNDDRNRPALAQTFEEVGTGEKFTVAVNHFKSKGSSGLDDTNDPNFDQGDGQGFWNAVRTDAANALTNWLATDPTNSNDPDYLIIGDLNAYAQEDPITAIENAGYTNLAEQFNSGAYSYVFDGQFGTLDYALANSALSSQVTGATEWHINADEPDALDYNLNFGRDRNLFNGDEPFRASDHDPLIVGLDLSSSGGATSGSDSLVGTQGNDTIDGLAGDDTVKGGGGDDILLGNDDNDRLIGNRGQDTLIGGAGNDTIIGGLGDDIVIGVDPDSATPGLGERDVMRGQDGGDRFILGDTNTVYYVGEGNVDRVVIRDFEPGTDLIVIPGSFEDYIIRENAIGSTIIRDASRDIIAVVRQASVTESDFNLSA